MQIPIGSAGGPMAISLMYNGWLPSLSTDFDIDAKDYGVFTKFDFPCQLLDVLDLSLVR
jgi:hypothetical protein